MGITLAKNRENEEKSKEKRNESAACVHGDEKEKLKHVANDKKLENKEPRLISFWMFLSNHLK